MTRFYTTRDQQVTRSYQESFIKTIAIQEILWVQMPKGFKCDFELISPLKAKVTDYKASAYIRFVVQAKGNAVKPQVVEGEYLYLQVPLKTWERAMYSIPMDKKRNWNMLGDDNIFLTFDKKNRTLLEFDNVERRECSDEQKKISEEYYDD